MYYYYEFFRDKEEQQIMYFNHDLTYFNHIHRAVEIMWCEDETLDVNVNGEKRTMQNGDICFVHSEWQHECTDHGSNTCLLLPPNVLDDYFRYLGERQPGGFLVTRQDAAPLWDFFDKYVRERICTIDNQLEVKGLVNCLLGMFIDKLGLVSRDKRIEGDLNIVSKIVEYIGQHFAEELSIESVADALNYNKYYISKVFNNVMNISFRDYVNMIRLSDFRANFNKDKSLEHQIADCGFTSRQTFYRAFKKQYGTTPNEFFKTASQKKHTFFADVRA